MYYVLAGCSAMNDYHSSLGSAVYTGKLFYTHSRLAAVVVQSMRMLDVQAH